ncbi:hypothetical protein [Pygmaiobacter massiliensis]|uniref:hypothetical protein n=1 Tax=Pygmaiobacter massiliensis TaxID=1917873 RepID=UPI0028A0E087|nr:hypothetical protein [Pygmaiobacter massiliensis]
MEVRKAYDTFLQSEVSADLAAKSGGLEPYRYECAHCGEEVRLAAAGSTSMVAHFRHLSGNNDVDCEKYLGQYGSISIDARSRKSRNERAEFYFDSGSKMFYLGLCFSKNEIDTYEEESARFELRTTAQGQPFSSLRINNINFLPDTPRMIPIDQFSYCYYLSNTLNNVKRRYDFFKKDGLATFFKIQGNDDYYRARLIRSTILYTDVPYFVAVEGQYSFPQSSCFISDVEISDTCRFETMGRRVLGQVLTIKNKTSDVEALFASWGYQVEASETLTLLWPPATQINEASVVCSENAFLFSSFNLEPHGNINVHSLDIQVLGSGVSKISVHSRVKVLRKNAEIIIDRDTACPADYDPLPLAECHAHVYTVSDDNTYFLFNRSGATLIVKGQSVLLTLGSFVKRYTSGYLDGVIYPRQQKGLSGELFLNDLLAHYKRTENFSLDSFAALDLSDTASRYIEECIETGVINSAAKRFIEEGRI